MKANLSSWRTGLAVLIVLALAVTVTGVLAPVTLAAFTTTTTNLSNELHTATLASTGLTAHCDSEDRVDLTWTPSGAGAVTGYRIERRRQREDDFSPLTTVTPRTTGDYSDTDTPFTLAALSLGGTVTVEYRIQAEIAGTDWRSAAAEASTSGTATTVLFITSFSCN